MQVDSDDAMLSRSNSVQLPEDGEPGVATRRSSLRRDKGKGKERVAPVRVKEEPAVVSLCTNESPLLNASVSGAIGSQMSISPPSQSNEDHCSACRSLGSLVYCDGCPRAFHLICLDPPMEPQDLPAGDARWYCPACMLSQVRRRPGFTATSTVLSAPRRNRPTNPPQLSDSCHRS